VGDARLMPRRAPLLVGYVVATFLAFPHPIAGRVLDLGLLCAWLSPGLLLLGLEGLPPRRAFRTGFVAALAAHAAIFHWIYVVTVVYGHAPPVVGVIGPLGLGAYMAAFTALFALGMAWLARWNAVTPWSAALLWAALDHLRSFALTGLPWATLGYAQHLNDALRPWTAFTGVYGLSFLSVLGGAALAFGARDLRAGRRPTWGTGLALGTVVAAHVFGFVIGRGVAPDPGSSVRLAVLQGNIEQGVKWDPAWAERTLGIYEELSRRAAAEGAELVIWPETAVPGVLEADPEQRERLWDLARETGASFVLGVVGIDASRPGRRPLFFDSALVLEADRGFTERYDKSHLVPFGEYLPFAELLEGLRAVASGIASEGVTPGPAPRAVQISVPEAGPLTVGVPICYELIFPDLVRRFVRDGAEVLFGITNDAWYGRTGAPYQFLAITALRSAETRVWTARAANTGVSAIIDAGGRVRARTRIFERDLLVYDVPLRPGPAGGSFYTRHGDVFAWGCWLGSLLLFAAARFRATGNGVGESS